MTDVRKGQAPAKLQRSEFQLRFMRTFADPRFDKLREEVAKLEEVAWQNFSDSRKAPLTEPAGPGFADPGYELSLEWKAAAARLRVAEERQKNPATPSRVLLVCGAARNDGSCPGEISKTWRMLKLAEATLAADGIVVDILDLSRLTSEFQLRIHPCKGCVSTAMPLCHWPCSCYPNHSLGQVDDWMNDIYEQWVSAHGIIIFTPVYWYQAPSVLKLMIDRWCVQMAAIRIQAARMARSPKKPKHWSLQAGPTPNTWPGAPMAWWCTATSPAPKACGATCPTGWTGWG